VPWNIPFTATENNPVRLVDSGVIATLTLLLN
jgi:hypothetical protein